MILFYMIYEYKSVNWIQVAVILGIRAIFNFALNCCYY